MKYNISEVEHMILNWSRLNPYNKLVRKIKREIIISLQRKGIAVSQVHVDLNQNKVRLRMFVSENYRYSIK